MVGCCTAARPAGRCRAVPAGRSMAGPARPGPDRTWGLLAKQRSGCWSCAAPAVTGVFVRGVPWWGVVSSAAAPVLMVAGWTVAAGLQPRSFDPVAQPVSVLAAPGAADRWVMTLTFLVVGACDVVTGISLRPARAPGRLILMAAAAAGILVAANSEDPGTSFPLPPMIWAAAGWAALVAWPAGAWRRGPSVPWGLRPAVSASAVTVLLALLAWFGAELITGGGQGRPGRARLRRRAGAVAAGSGGVLPPCRQGGSQARPCARPEPVGCTPCRRRIKTGLVCAQLMFHDVPPGIVTGCLTEPACMIIHGLVSPETHYFAAWRGGCSPAGSAPDGCGMILIERRVGQQRTRYIVLFG